jgi:hypothetical protein
MPIQKITIVTTVLTEADTADDAKATFSSTTLARIGEDIDTGESLGTICITSVETVPPEKLKLEMALLGNDGTFFEPESDARFLNHYRCSECGHEWEDEWSCACNDRCVECDAEIEPYQSKDLTVERP